MKLLKLTVMLALSVLLLGCLGTSTQVEKQSSTSALEPVTSPAVPEVDAAVQTSEFSEDNLSEIVEDELEVNPQDFDKLQ